MKRARPVCRSAQSMKNESQLRRFTISMQSLKLSDTVCINPRVLRLPFKSVRSLRSLQATALKTAAAEKSNSSVLPAGLASFLISLPAFADEIALNTEGSGLPNSLSSSTEITNKSLQAGGSVIDLFADNPIVVVGLAFLAAVPIALNFLGGGSLGVKSVSAAGALEGLSSDPSTILLDIRSREEAKEQGSPNLSAAKKKAILLPFTRLIKGEVEQVADFADRFNQLKQIQSDVAIIILDSYGQEAPKAAKLLAKAVGKVFYVKDGAVGPRGWKESGQPWKEPGKALLNLDSLAEDFKRQPTFAKAGVAAGAVGVAAAVLFQEASTVLELAAVAAAGAIALPSFLSGSSAAGKSGAGSSTEEQVKDLVKEGKKEAQKATQKATKEVTKQAEKASSNDLGSKIKSAVSDVKDNTESAIEKSEKVVEEPQQAASKAVETADDLAAKASETAEKNTSEASTWIEDWRKKNLET